MGLTISGQALPNKQTQTLGSAAASITFTVPVGYTNLRLFFNGRGTAAAANVPVSIRCNSDTGTNYQAQLVYSAAGTAAGFSYASQTSFEIVNCPAATGPANFAGSAVVFIPDYAGTTFYKQISSVGNDTAAAATESRVYQGVWKNTAAIATIVVFPSTGNLEAGSNVTLIAE